MTTQQQYRLICLDISNKMRRCDILSGILLILSIIDFALAAPVLVQEKRQAYVDVVYIPQTKDVISVLGKRGITADDLLDEFYRAVDDHSESSKAHASSSSVPSGPDHGSMSVVQALPPNPALSTPNPNPLMRPSGPSRPDHASGSTSVVQTPPPNPASSTPNPNLLMRPSGLSAAAPVQGS